MTATDPVARLYRHHDQPTATLAALPVSWRQIAFDADVSDEHLAGLVVWIGAGLAAVVVAWSLFGVFAGVAAFVVVVVVPLIIVARWRGRRVRRLVDALPEVVEMVARSLRSGASFPQALAEAKADAAPVVAYELGQLLVEIGRGRTTTLALRAWADRHSHGEIRIVAAALALAWENESGTTQALAGVSQSLRDRAMLSAEISAQAAQAVASMHAMVLLPGAFLAVDALVGQGTLRFLVGDRIGRYCLAAAVVLEIVGWVWMRMLTGKRMPA